MRRIRALSRIPALAATSFACVLLAGCRTWRPSELPLVELVGCLMSLEPTKPPLIIMRFQQPEAALTLHNVYYTLVANPRNTSKYGP